MYKQSVVNEYGYLIYRFEAKEEIDKNEKTVKLIACGDTGPVRRLETIVLEKGPDSVLNHIGEILSKGDIVFANLEAPYSKRGKPINRIPTFRLQPDAFSIIKKSHINVVSLANNHIFDYGLDAFDDTIFLLRTNRIKYFGAGRTEDEALKPAILSVNDIRFGFLGFIDIESKIKNFPRGITPPGITPQMHYEKVKQAIAGLRPKVDWIILSLHFGWEYQLYPSPKDVKLCRKFIDEGADIILGHHPHYPQGIEQYENGLIAYSLGNFIWDQNFIGHTNSSYLLELLLSKDQIRIARLTPFRLNRNYQLEISESDDTYKELNHLSAILSDEAALNEKWYFICRDKFIELCVNLCEAVFSLKPKPYYLMLWCRNIISPRTRVTLLSLSIFILSLKALKHELKRQYRKYQNRRLQG